ncbi:hypothetical protein OBV_21860 [Oscillibacter valericigenes Sjm18-20]|nr:hypothetical protein OBV_21860 [Oscillibacter valericigenes Sjm18-20]
MQKYRDIDATPMAYYKFLTRFALILDLILTVCCTVYMILNNPYWVDILYSVAVVVLELVCLIWLWKMKWKGVLALYAGYLLSILYKVVTIVQCINDGTDFSFSVGQLNSVLVIAVLTWVYFNKRRFLFSPIPPWGDEGDVIITKK